MTTRCWITTSANSVTCAKLVASLLLPTRKLPIASPSANTNVLIPDVERLLECFAFLSAKLNRKLDDDYTQFSNALLEQLYPHAIRPLPVTAIARFMPDPAKGNLARLPHPTANSAVRHHDSRDSVYFRTTAAQTLWPLQIAEAQLLDAEEAQALSGLPHARSALKLTLECLAPHQWAALPVERLRIHLTGSAMTSATLYDLLAAHSIGPLSPNRSASVLMNACCRKKEVSTRSTACFQNTSPARKNFSSSICPYQIEPTGPMPVRT